MSDHPVICNYGGGLNSMAMLIGLRDRGEIPDLVIFADTGNEKPETYSFIRRILPPWLHDNDFPELVIVRRVPVRVAYRTLEENCLQNKTLPSIAFGMKSCSMKWKREPMDKWLNQWGPARSAWDAGRKPIKLLGFDAGEWHRSRAKIADEKFSFAYPLIDWGWDRDDCARVVRAERLPTPPKSACFFCPNSTKAEVLALKETHPDLFERACAIERNAETGDTIKGLGRGSFSWEELGKADDRQLKLFPDIYSEMPCECMD